MQDLLNNFGVNWFLLIAQIVNFLIVLYLLKRFAFGPILKLLESRRRTIAESLENAEETKRLLQKTEEREKEVLKKAQIHAQAIIADAKKQADTMSQEAELNTKIRVAKLLEDAQKRIDDQTKAAEKQLASQVTHLSVEILEKSLQGFFTDKEQKEVLERAMKKMRI